MKILFIPVLKKQERVDFSAFSKLPKKISIAYSIQYKQIAEDIYKELKKSRKIEDFKQVLGCSKVKFKEKTVLLIADGRFHALNLALQGYDVYIYNSSIIHLSEEEIETLKKKRKAALINFYNSEEKAVIVSIKPGQYNLKKALELRKKYNLSIFLADNINMAELENFSPKSWINTACPTLIYDSTKIVNPEEIY
jgi:diphthamide biosynthesis enzyme Dph1/Dph2-like protein